MTQAPLATPATAFWAAPRRDSRSRRPRSTASSLAAAIAAACRGEEAPEQRARSAEGLLRSALRAGMWLPSSVLETDPSRYRSRTLHVDHESGITIRVLAWRRAQRTPIHDHVAWCVIGVYAGSERELRYSAVDVRGGTRLRVVADHKVRAGETAVLLPPDDIHEVSCLTENAVSIHIYGQALEAETPSMRQSYERSAVASPALPVIRPSHV
ncbi:MAG: cysteine dioxygenase family protein [Candidatus Dormibacteraeota bacterium]|nr:cysteine dioxygenase family protein [Candidatus Dormibacteraeota bacterium]